VTSQQWNGQSVMILYVLVARVFNAKLFV